jgi:hypothetical protein
MIIRLVVRLLLFKVIAVKNERRQKQPIMTLIDGVTDEATDEA